jgi:hypothetical protein
MKRKKKGIYSYIVCDYFGSFFLSLSFYITIGNYAAIGVYLEVGEKERLEAKKIFSQLFQHLIFSIQKNNDID